MMKNGIQSYFDPENLLPEGFLLHKIFYKIKLTYALILLNRPNEVVPPTIFEKFGYVLNPGTIEDQISKNWDVIFFIPEKKRKTCFRT